MVPVLSGSAVSAVLSVEELMPFCFLPSFHTTGFLCCISIRSSALMRMAQIGTLSVTGTPPSTKTTSKPSSADIRTFGARGSCLNRSSSGRSLPSSKTAFRFIPCSSCRYAELPRGFLNLPHKDQKEIATALKEELLIESVDFSKLFYVQTNCQYC